MSLDIINVEKRYLNRASGTTINALNGVSIKVEVGQPLGAKILFLLMARELEK